MKTNFFDILQVSKSWANYYGFKNCRTYQSENFYHVNTEGVELGFNSLLDLADDLAEYETSVHSVSFDTESGCLVINIYK